jgi:hypothetical protein
MVVKHRRALIKSARVPRVFKLVMLVIKVVAKLMAEGTQQCSKGSHLLSHCRAHPNPDLETIWSIVPKKLGSPTTLSHPLRAGGEHADSGLRDAVEIRRHPQEFAARTVDGRGCPARKGESNGPRCCVQSTVRRYGKVNE